MSKLYILPTEGIFVLYYHHNKQRLFSSINRLIPAVVFTYYVEENQL
jgi:hypothetical protein